MGDPLPTVDRIEITNGPEASTDARWVLQGVTSNERYVERTEKDTLVAKQVALGRTEARLAAMIPIRKNAQWWAMTQEERREILETRSRHIQIGLKYLPAIARRLHHCRDLTDSQPFDFITLFDYHEEDATAFDELVAALRESEEWKFINREFDIRMLRQP